MTPPLPAKRPLTTVDIAIFSIRDGRLCVLLVKRPSGKDEPYPGRWALPGGFVDLENDKSLEDCAVRKLREKTGVASPYLEQLGSWGDAKRDPRGWSATHVYLALIAGPEVKPEAGGNAPEADWFPVADSGVAGRLAFDHKDLLAAALARIRAKVEYTSLPVHLVDEPFTLTELQRAYEIVMGRPVNKAAFRKRILDAGIVESTGEFRGGQARPAELFRHARAAERLAYFPRTFSPRP
ncbi:MAG: NUDIX hydrolase [Burkholderiales bacterium]|nr:NUDIX hydrolase [Burkholderiales bacterium]